MTRRECLTALIGSAMILGFAYFDLSQPRGVAAGVPYVAAVAVSLISESRRLLISFGVTAIILCIAGAILSTPGVSMFTSLLNRAIALYAILAVTVPGVMLLKRHEVYDAKLLRMATTDGLTESNNRRAILAELRLQIEEASRYHFPLSVLMLDIDDFKQVNDQLGHLAGDRVLQVISRTCQRCMRNSDRLGRYGGEEFLCVCPHTTLDDVLTLAERTRRQVASLRWPDLDKDLHVTLSIGAAGLSKDSATIREMISCADKALLAAKNAGKNRVQRYGWTEQIRSRPVQDINRPRDETNPAIAPMQRSGTD